MLPVGFHVNSSDFRLIPGPELTGSGWICRWQRVVLLFLVLLLLVVVVSLLVALLGVISRFPPPFKRLPGNSGPRADRIWLDLSGASGCFVVVGFVVGGGGGGGVVGGVVGCYSSLSTSN